MNTIISVDHNPTSNNYYTNCTLLLPSSITLPQITKRGYNEIYIKLIADKNFKDWVATKVEAISTTHNIYLYRVALKLRVGYIIKHGYPEAPHKPMVEIKLTPLPLTLYTTLAKLNNILKELKNVS